MHRAAPVRLAFTAIPALLLAACGGDGTQVDTTLPIQATYSDGPGPATLPAEFRHPVGNATAGRDVFRFETFGNQRFWTDVLQLPQGIAAARLTPLQALQLGLNVNVEALNAPTVTALGQALAQVQGGANPATTAFGDPAVTLSLINQNAVQGVVVFDPAGRPKAPGNTGMLDLAAGDKVGVTCALCHSTTDNSVLPPTPALQTIGSVGKAVDGPIAAGIDIGTILAAAANSRAYYPLLQVSFNALGGATIGRPGATGLRATATTLPTEAEADAYLTGSTTTGERFYPRVSFDAIPDGIGNPTYITPLFRTALAAPWGVDGGVAQLQDFNNLVYTVGLDPTSLVTTGGRAALRTLAGGVGDEIADTYQRILQASGALPAGQTADAVFPLVTATRGTFAPGSPEALTGFRVDETKLRDLNAYLDALPGPARVAGLDTSAVERGREIFRRTSPGGGNCTSCHQADPNRFVPTNVVPVRTLYPGYAPMLIADRPAPLTPIQDSAGPVPTFDDRVVVLDASVRVDASKPARDAAKGFALPLLLDLDRKRFLLHDSSVGGANFSEAATRLLDPARGATAPHPYYLPGEQDRRDVVAFLRSLAAN